MRSGRNRRDEDDLDWFRRLTEDDVARRELLWIRAQEKEDETSLEMLERADPKLRARMTELLAQRGLDDDRDPRRRREELGRLYDERLEAYRREFEAERRGPRR